MLDRHWSTASDEALLRACRQGDMERFAQLWERHRLAGAAAARGLAPGLDADDLVSEAYLKIYELVRKGRGPTGAFRPYLYQVIKTIAADQLRSPERTSAQLEDIPDLHEAGPWEDNAFDLNALATAFATLPPRWQAVLWYTEVEQMPPRKAAALLALSANATSALAVRARDALKSAWVEAHVDRELAEAECRTTLERLQRYQRGKLTARASREVAAHLDTCENCERAAAEFSMLNRKLGLALSGLVLGSAGAAGLLAELGFMPSPAATAATAAQPASSAQSGEAAAGAGSGTTAGAGTAGATGSAWAGAGLGAKLLAVVTAPTTLIVGGVVAAAAIVTAGALVISSVTAPPAEESSSEQGETQAPPDAPQPKPQPRTRDDAKGAQDDLEVETIVTEAATDTRRLVPVPEPAPPPPVPVPEPTPEPEPEPEPEPTDDGDPTILPGYDCYLSGALIVGSANEYGVIRLRATQGASAPVELMNPLYDPADTTGTTLFDPGTGLFDDGRGNTFDFGFFTGTDPDPGPYDWLGEDPTLFPGWASSFGSLTLADVTLEMRLVTPDGRYSQWTAIDTGITC